MITHHITVVCNSCDATLPTERTTGHGARGDAERAGWRVAYLAGGMHPTKRSNAPEARDLCPNCRPDKLCAPDLPRADVGLFAPEVES